MKRLSVLLFLCMLVLAGLVFVSTSTAEPAVANISRNCAAWASTTNDYNQCAHLATDGFDATYWEADGGNPQWIYVDLGVEANVNQVVLKWGTPYGTSYKIQTSTDGGRVPVNWTERFSKSDGRGGTETINLGTIRARWVRLYISSSSDWLWGGSEKLYEFQVLGTGGKPPRPTKRPTDAGGVLMLDTGCWRLQNQAFVADAAEAVSSNGYNDADWLVATVPGTIVSTYIDNGAIPDPYYSDWSNQHSESFFTYNKFWYRSQFTVPSSYAGKRILLNLEGVNYRADVYVNGTKLGRLSGAFKRGKYDVTQYVTPGQDTTVALLIYPVENPDDVVVTTLNNIPWGGRGHHEGRPDLLLLHPLGHYLYG